MAGLRVSKKRKSLDQLRERLRYLGFKARKEPKALTLEELDELCTIIEALKPAGKAPSLPPLDDHDSSD